MKPKSNVAEPALPISPRRILVAEDDAVNIALMRNLLEGQEWVLAFAHTGIEAISMAKEFSPEIIFLDVNMPEMSGWEAARQLRSLEQFKHTPIIAQSASGAPEDRQLSLECGMNAHLTKPLDREELTAVLAKYLD